MNVLNLERVYLTKRPRCELIYLPIGMLRWEKKVEMKHWSNLELWKRMPPNKNDVKRLKSDGVDYVRKHHFVHTFQTFI